MSGDGRINATVVVLGDLGRSPRMQYHARSLADVGAEVDLVGYAGSDLPESIVRHPKIRCHRLPPRPMAFLDRLPRLLSPIVYLGRSMIVAIRLLGTLIFSIEKPDVLLLQNPPAIPALAVLLVVARWRSARLVIDWHNFSYTMVALKVSPAGLPVRLTRWYERTLGRRADGHFCVSAAMQRMLASEWGLPEVSVVYDRPARAFAPPRGDERAELRRRVAELLALDSAIDVNRIALLVSATSWTPDEDFDLLIDAVKSLERRIADFEARKEYFPALGIVISGEGPLRRFYEERIARLDLRRIRIRTIWLSPEQYPLLLRGADIGLCLHRSSSGLDLPMKIADMLGSGLPVVAFDYGACLAERLRHGDNGLLFTTAGQLADHIVHLFKDFPSAPTLDHLRKNVAAAAEPRWDAEWNTYARPALLNISAKMPHAQHEKGSAARR